MMRLLTKTLDLLFRRIPAKQLLLEIVGDGASDILPFIKSSFLDVAESSLCGYSRDEQSNILQLICQIRGKYTERKNLPPFFLLIEYSNNVFVPGKRLPMCQREKLLSWREVSLHLGQDLFATAWLAQSDQEPLNFSWPATVPVHGMPWNAILKDLAENHLHLYAGASTFSISWSCAMNYPMTVVEHGDDIEKMLQMHFSRKPTASAWSIKRHILYAAFIRMLLFERIHNVICDISPELHSFHARYTTDDLMGVEIAQRADRLRFLYGLAFAQPHSNKPACLDYACCGELEREREADSRLLAGERKLLYECFRRCNKDKVHPGFSFSEKEQWIFYLYLLLKIQFRGELIQINQETGFHNFHDYDSRKFLLWKECTSYWNEDYRQALNAALKEQSISSLEGRVSPKDTAFEDVSLIHNIDRAKLYHDGRTFEERWNISHWHPSYHMVNLAEQQPFHYVIHFPKKKDVPLPKGNASLTCRHEQYRSKIREQAIELAKAMSNCDYLCDRIRGIDACSNEIYCRPEVFATAFRFLRAFPVGFYRRTAYSRAIPELSVTYHVGEDFLDIADGLRAIDEAIHFLNMQRGDRIGHALALGVDPAIHYKRKHYQVVLPQQDLLDNLVWLYYRSADLGVELPQKLERQFKSLAMELFAKIYEPYTQEKHGSLEDYYHSMLLRGDSPRCYVGGAFSVPSITSPFDEFCVNNNVYMHHDFSLYRRLDKVADLCFCYHYCLGAKREGAKLCQMEITPAYIGLIRTMQEAIQNLVCDKGIGIECNPSSNVLIGTFDSYQDHPIFNFYTEGLNLPRKLPQMHVSVNSDDPGVFDTTLSFEYMLLAQSLASITDENGNRMHSDREIENYLRNLVRMGQEQCFPKAGSR